MCEWCDRLSIRNWKWNHHADYRGMYFVFKQNRNTKYKIDEFWRRAGKWVDSHAKHHEIGRRHYGRGYGSRWYERD